MNKKKISNVEVQYFYLAKNKRTGVISVVQTPLAEAYVKDLEISGPITWTQVTAFIDGNYKVVEPYYPTTHSSTPSLGMLHQNFYLAKNKHTGVISVIQTPLTEAYVKGLEISGPTTWTQITAFIDGNYKVAQPDYPTTHSSTPSLGMLHQKR